jgi:hypothetical protein
MSRPDRPDRGDSEEPQSTGSGTTNTGAAKPGVSRRTLFSLLGVAAVAAVLVPTVFHSKESALPEPTGQVMGTDYRAATLKFKPAPTTPMPENHSEWNSCAAGAPSKMSDLDLVIAIDTTGSMGPVINDVKASVARLINTLQSGSGNVRVGVVAYRDVGDEYVVRQYPLTDLKTGGAEGLTAFIGGLIADGGGDWPERVDAAVQAAESMNWRPGVPGSIVVIGDAPAHLADQSAALSGASSFHKQAGHQISVIDAGSGAHPFMQALPSAGGGQFVTYDGNILNSMFPAITGIASK